MKAFCKLAALCFAVLSIAPAGAADYPQPKEASWIAKDFRFSTGEVFPELRIAYTPIGAPTGEPVLLLHGTTGSAASLLNKDFADELFGPGQPLDAARYYLIIPDALGTGKSSRPSDGLRAKFPRYNYDDMVHAQHRLLTEGLGIPHLRLVIGNSMGGMQAWLWATKYPSFMDAIVPMACLPVAMSGRNHMLRRMLTQAIRNDPDWMGGNQALYKQAPDYWKGDALIAQRLAVPFRGDANDTLYQWESSADYDPSLGLERIRAMVLAINASDDERNPPELGVMEEAMKRLKAGRYVLLQGGPDTRGHGTTGMAKLWSQYLAELLQHAPRR
jgi:homoserine O-acetyltransferase